MIQFERCCHISILVADVDRSRKFYSEVLGLEEIFRPTFPFDGIWYSLKEGFELHIIKADMSITYPKPRPFSIQYPHLAIWVEDGDKTWEEMKKKNLSEVNTVLTLTGLRQVYIFDPDDNMIEFMGPTKEK